MASPNTKGAAASSPVPRTTANAHASVTPVNVRVRTRTRLPALQPKIDPEADYSVGYGKPPLEGRFKKGKSGNPKGRTKGARNLKTEILAEVSELIVVRENGKSRRVPKIRALVKRLIEQGLQGDTRAIQIAFSLLRTLFPDPPDQGVDPESPLADDDLALLLEFAGRQRIPSKEKK